MRRKQGTPHNFFLAFTDELEKIKWAKWANEKNKIILIFTILHF